MATSYLNEISWRENLFSMFNIQREFFAVNYWNLDKILLLVSNYLKKDFHHSLEEEKKFLGD